MADVLYIFDRIPFISGVKYNTINSESYISKKEIKKYIKIFNVKMNSNSNFKLYDERTWKL